MFAFLIVVIALVAFFIITIVLLQSGKGGGLAAEFGGATSSTDSIMGGRQAANVLTKASWIGGGVFMALAMVLAILASQETAPQSSILRQEFGGQSGGQLESVLENEGQGAEPASVLDEGDAAGAGEGDAAPAEEDGSPE